MARSRGQPGARRHPSEAQRQAVELLDDALLRAVRRLVDLLDCDVPLVALRAAEALVDRGLADTGIEDEPERDLAALPRVERIRMLSKALELERQAEREEMPALEAHVNAPEGSA